MKTIQMTIDEDLLDEVDGKIKELDTTRSAFMRLALKTMLHRLKIEEMERQHREGYLRIPQQIEEITEWEDEQVWGDE